MATITTRQTSAASVTPSNLGVTNKGAPLTNAELDANLIQLNYAVTSNVAISGGAIDNTSIGATTASTGKFTSLTTPSVTATSTDLTLSAISTGNINLNTPNGTALKVLSLSFASSNWLQVGNPATTVIRLGPAGTSVCDFRIHSQTFTSFYTGSSTDGLSEGSRQFQINNTASAVNYLTVTGSATGNAATISVAGSDAAVPLTISSKSYGSITLSRTRDATNATSYLMSSVGGLVGDANGGAFWRGFHQSGTLFSVSAVNNFIRLSSYHELDATADPTVKNWWLTLGNTTSPHNFVLSNDTGGNIDFKTGSANGTNLTLRVVPGSTFNNYVQITGAANGSAPTISAQGSSDTNINLALAGKGTGNITSASPLVLTGGGTALTLNNATNNRLSFSNTGTGAPTFTTYSNGVKIALFDSISGTDAGYTLGIESGALFSTVATTAMSWKWYGGTTLAATLTGAGALTTVGAIQGTTLTSTVSTGTAPFTVSSTTNVANLNASSLNGATFAAPGAIGSGTASTGAFTTLSASSTVSGTGFSTYLASPPAIGGTVAAAGTFTTLVGSTSLNIGGGTINTSNTTATIAIGVTVQNVSTTLPFLQTYNTNAGTDLKYWRSGGNNSGDYVFQSVNDAYSASTTRLTISSGGIVSDGKGDVRAAPVNTQTAAYVITAADAGKHINITTGGVTVNVSTLAVGDMVTIYNNSASSQTITSGTSVTMYLAGTATTGNRTLAQRGLATILCVTSGASAVYVISGAGLT